MMRISRKAAFLAICLSNAFIPSSPAQNATSASPVNTLGGTPFPPPSSAQLYGTDTHTKNPRAITPLYGPPTIGTPNPVYENQSLPNIVPTNTAGASNTAVTGGIGAIGSPNINNSTNNGPTIMPIRNSAAGYSNN